MGIAARRFQRAAQVTGSDPASEDVVFTATSGLWSQASNWQSGKVPAQGDRVWIGNDAAVTLDEPTPELGLLTITHGSSLTFQDGHAHDELVLRAQNIDLDGTLSIGTEEQVYASQAAIELCGAAQPEMESGTMAAIMGHKRISMHHGKLLVYGAFQGETWTRLSQTAPVGATTITVDSTTGWTVGERIVLTSSDFYQGVPFGEGEQIDRQVEERTVTAINHGTKTVTLNEPLVFLHFGQTQSYTDVNNQPRTLESRAEVIRLTRNIVIRSEDETADPQSDRYRFGGQVMLMGDSELQLHGAEVTNMGQHGTLLRYPIHFHLMRDEGAKSSLSRNAIHHVYNRGLTIHGTNGVTVERNAIFHTFGHAFFLEDGAETGNTFTGNIAAQIIRPTEEHALLASDRNPRGPTAYWITNPDNTFIDNVAASVIGSGFWYALPANPTGSFAIVFPEATAAIFPRRTPLGVFRGNTAHSIADDGLHVDTGPTSNGSTVETVSYNPRVDPANPNAAPQQAIFENFVSWKIAHRSVWTRGAYQTIKGGIQTDHLRGVTMASSSVSRIEDVVFVGETENTGTPRTPREIATGRSMPRSYDNPSSNHLQGYAFPICGYAFYDTDVFISDSSFHHYQPNDNRYASALGINEYTNFRLHPNNGARNLTFHDSLRYWHGPIPPDFPGPSDGYRQATILDTDGSITGIVGATIVPAMNTLLYHNASPRPEWGAGVRNDTDFAQLFVENRTETAGPLQVLTVTSNTYSGTYHNQGNAGNAFGNNPSAIIPAYDADLSLTYSGEMSHSIRLLLAHYPPAFDSANPATLRPSVTVRIDYPASLTPLYIYRDTPNTPLEAAASLEDFDTQAEDELYFHDLSSSILHIRLRTRANENGTIRNYASALVQTAPL